jgi:hypothetical protein
MRSTTGPSWARLNPSERYSLGTGNNTSRRRVERKFRIQGVVFALLFVFDVVEVADGLCALGIVRGGCCNVVVDPGDPVCLLETGLLEDKRGFKSTNAEGREDFTGEEGAEECIDQVASEARAETRVVVVDGAVLVVG